MSRTDIPTSLALLEDTDLLIPALYKLMLPHARDSSSFVHLETVSDAAGLCGSPQIIKVLSPLASFEHLSKNLR